MMQSPSCIMLSGLCWFHLPARPPWILSTVSTARSSAISMSKPSFLRALPWPGTRATWYVGRDPAAGMASIGLGTILDRRASSPRRPRHMFVVAAKHSLFLSMSSRSSSHVRFLLRSAASRHITLEFPHPSRTALRDSRSDVLDDDSGTCDVDVHRLELVRRWSSFDINSGSHLKLLSEYQRCGLPGTFNSSLSSCWQQHVLDRMAGAQPST
mmetsp:Transcript_125840/g.355830  ORF Transcript_125840/g.355830 Transcript_125840/m.355830 type:complete len:212 (-) Transcript_125840:139-774(-)